MFTIRSHNGATWKADFYIQSKGNNAGRPMKISTANCFGVVTDREVLLPDYFYYVVLAAHERGAFKPYIKGSVIPYITINDFLKALGS